MALRGEPEDIPRCLARDMPWDILWHVALSVSSRNRQKCVSVAKAGETEWELKAEDGRFALILLFRFPRCFSAAHEDELEFFLCLQHLMYAPIIYGVREQCDAKVGPWLFCLRHSFFLSFFNSPFLTFLILPRFSCVCVFSLLFSAWILIAWQPNNKL